MRKKQGKNMEVLRRFSMKNYIVRCPVEKSNISTSMNKGRIYRVDNSITVGAKIAAPMSQGIGNS